MPVTDTDWDLVKRCLDGDASAFVCLQVRYEHLVWDVVQKLTRNPSDVEDVCQGVWISAWKSLRYFEPGRPFLPWIAKIAGNHAIDAFRKRDRRQRHEVQSSQTSRDGEDDECGVPELPSREPEPLEEIICRETGNQLLPVMAESIRSLRTDYRRALLLRYGRSLTDEEIASELGVKRQTATTWVHRARKQLDREVRARGVEQPDLDHSSTLMQELGDLLRRLLGEEFPDHQS